MTAENKTIKEKTMTKNEITEGTCYLIDKGEGKPYLAQWTVGRKTFYKTTGETDYKKAQAKLREFIADAVHHKIDIWENP